MSALSDAMTSALAAVADFKGETLQYRTTHAGSLTTLVGFVLGRDRIPQPSWTTEAGGVVSNESGWLKGPLTPAMVIGYEVVDGDGLAWSIYSVMKNQQQVCLIRGMTTRTLEPDRGEAR